MKRSWLFCSNNMPEGLRECGAPPPSHSDKKIRNASEDERRKLRRQRASNPNPKFCVGHACSAVIEQFKAHNESAPEIPSPSKRVSCAWLIWRIHDDISHTSPFSSSFSISSANLSRRPHHRSCLRMLHTFLFSW